jgi:fermentation-respiration switch protein FrsA (DUF1100 family)
LLRDQFHSDERIAGVTAPLLIMHGGRDSTISIGFGERLFALAHEPKQFVRFPEAATTIWTIMVLPKRLDISSALQKADGWYGFGT